ncbi:MAG: hypothetical protein KDA24_18080 [Deltaproteobacteria bacterium]|nr:hypothetical protein [Deltaproteobacteria bacterium]
MRSLLAFCALFVLLLVGCGEPPAEVASAEAPCCSLDDVIAMHDAGVDDELIIASLAKSAQEVEPTAQDLIRLSEAGVSKPVVKALLGEQAASDAATDATEATPESAPAVPEAKPAHATMKAAPAKPKGPPPLSVHVAYAPGGKSFSITNTGGTTYTRLVLTANGDYVYALPIPLPPGNPDTIRLRSFTSTTGHKLHPAEGLKSLRVKAQQGSWSKSF